MRSVELFAGCGGLALGLSRAGFEHALVVERDEQALTTLVENKKRGVRYVADWPLAHKDVRDVDYSHLGGVIDVVAGGPPCQPFSIGGKHLGPDDSRNMWPEAVRAVRELMPKAFIFENVRGLLRPAFQDYLAYLKLTLSWPEIALRENENWREHSYRIAAYQNAKRNHNSTYSVIFCAINTADFGAHQKRHRAMTVGLRTDISANWTFPKPTHSYDSLIYSQYVSMDYWSHHNLDTENVRLISNSNGKAVSYLRHQLIPPSESPWLTVRDAIGDLPEPMIGKSEIEGHELHLGARVYARHTGSGWDEPAKALKSGNHGVPGGENILVQSDGSVRYFTLREMARLQGFPDNFHVPGRWKIPIKQLGNAVPVAVGEILGGKVKRILSNCV